jgi:hypothetical protein
MSTAYYVIHLSSGGRVAGPFDTRAEAKLVAADLSTADVMVQYGVERE